MQRNEPQQIVSDVVALTRTPVMSDVAQLMRDDADRSVSSQHQPVTIQQPVIGNEPPSSDDDLQWRYGNLHQPNTTKYVQNGKVAGYELDSEEAQQIVKHYNTNADIKINQLSELAGYMRWGTLGLMASAFGGLYASLGIGSTAGGAAATAAAATGAVATGATAVALYAAIGFGVAALVLGVATLLVSQSARKLQADRWLDVQEYLQDRGAVKIGTQVVKSLEKGLNAAPNTASNEAMAANNTMPSKEAKNWSEALIEEQASKSKMQLSHI